MTCPGSIRMSAGIPETSSRYAEEGTAAHTLAETILRSYLEPANEAARAAAIEAQLTATVEMLEAVEVYVDKVMSYARSGVEVIVLIEQRVTLDRLGLAAPVYGTSDLIAYVPSLRRLIVGDYKHGAGVAVEVEENTQLKIYGLGAWVSVAVPRGWIVESVETFICQPRKDHDLGPVRSHTYSAAEIVDFAFEVEAAVTATLDPEAALVAGDHCRFCPAKALCTARLDEMSAAVPAVFPGLPAVSAMSVEQAAEILAIADRVKFADWLDDVRGFLQAEAEQGRSVPGFKLVAKRANRSWKEADSVIVSRLAEHASESQLYNDPTLKTVAQIEKIVGKKNLPADLYAKESSGYNLVQETAKGEAVLVQPGSEFDAIEPA
jgi:hypothetical protein